MDMGQKIKLHRERLGMTLEELGKKVGVGKSTVRKWETGMIANMRRDKISKIAEALEVSPSYLMGWTTNPDPKYAETMEGKIEVIGNQMALADNELRKRIGDSLNNIDTPPEMLPNDRLDIKKAVELYDQFQSAPPEIQQAIETLLKASQSES
jgi:transcriptional regulator with XRE-family HTH domain